MISGVLDRARGCIVGAFIGDAAGAVLEFAPTSVTEKGVNYALTFPGGGVWKIAPG